MEYALNQAMEPMNQPNQNSPAHLPHVQTRPIPRIKVFPKPGIKRLKLPAVNPASEPAQESDRTEGQ
jgi:hypothetical protein